MYLFKWGVTKIFDNCPFLVFFCHF